MFDTCKVPHPLTRVKLRSMATTAADTRARILDTAWRLVGERGVDDVTIAQIAAASASPASSSTCTSTAAPGC